MRRAYAWHTNVARAFEYGSTAHNAIHINTIRACIDFIPKYTNNIMCITDEEGVLVVLHGAYIVDIGARYYIWNIP